MVDITGLICWFRTGLKYHAENYDVTAAPLKALGIHVRVVGCCVEINQCVGCTTILH